MMRIGKKFVCSSPNGSNTHSFYDSGKPSVGKYHVLLERHLGPCQCYVLPKG